MVRRIVTIGASLVLAVAATGMGWGHGFVSGVVSEQGRPIVGAAVVVDGGEPVLTDQDGRYTAEVEPGDRKVRITLRGYKPIEKTLKVDEDQTATADLILDPVVQLAISTAPTTLKRSEAGAVTVLVNNTAASDYSIDAVGLRVFAEGKDRSADFTVEAAAANPTSVKAGQTVTLSFNLKPGAAAPTGKVTFRASLFGFDTALGANKLRNASFETLNAAGRPTSWGFGTDNKNLSPDAKGVVLSSEAMTGLYSAEVRVPAAEAGDVRSYWSNPTSIKKAQKYVLSGYVKTENVVSEAAFGASVYVPVTGNDPYQQPNSPWITGTRDWRKSIIAFETADNGTGITAHCRGEIQQGTGVAWFDNLSLTEGAEDGSLTVTSADQSVEITGG